MALPENIVQSPEQSPVRNPVLRFKQNTDKTTEAQLRLMDGTVYTIPDTAAVWLKAVEFVTSPQVYFDKECTPDTDRSTGVVSVTLTAADLPLNGIWVGEFRVLDAEGNKVERFPAWVEVTGTLDDKQNYRPLSVAEIRLSVRDRCAEDNFLLDNFEWSDDEIMFAITRPVDWWNEMAPNGVPRYTYTSFPFRYHWLDAVIGELLKMAGLHLSRNRMNLTAGGINTDDKARAEMYMQASTKYIQEYRNWATAKIWSLNVRNFMGSTKNRWFGPTPISP